MYFLLVSLVRKGAGDLGGLRPLACPLMVSSKELKGEIMMASPVIAARNVVPTLQVWTNRPKKPSAPSGIPMVSRPQSTEFRSDSCSGLSEERLAALEKIEHTTNYPAGAIIFMEGQP